MSAATDGHGSAPGARVGGPGAQVGAPEEGATPEANGRLPSSQRVVVIGAGIVGNSLAYHLVKLGETDVTLLDKGPLPNPGGSTGHASNFIFPVDHSKEMTLLTLESMRQYKELEVFIESGGIEIARNERADAGAHAADGVGQVVGDRAGLAAQSRTRSWSSSRSSTRS